MDTPSYMKLRSRVVPLSPVKKRIRKRRNSLDPIPMQANKKIKVSLGSLEINSSKASGSDEENDEGVIFVSNSRDPLEYIDLTEQY